MKVFEDAWRRSDLPAGAVATIGNYDGIHRGQRATLDRVTARARELECPAAVITFDPHPARVLDPERAPAQLTTPAQKERLLGEAGIDFLVLVRFDEELAATPATVFAREFLHRRLDLRELHVGSRFAFGKGREGTLELLADLGGKRHPAFGVTEVTSGGRPISSTRIREAIASGDVDEARRLLGRPYEVTGTIERGAGKGRELGWPTINLAHENELLPTYGVYVTTVRVETADGAERDHPAVTNVGIRPTVHAESRLTVESHLLDYEGNLYGRRASVGFLRRLRGEHRFPDLEALRHQIAVDVDAARDHFERGRSRAAAGD